MIDETIVERRLPGTGRVVKLQMPDLYSMISAGAMPNALIGPILLLIEGVKPRQEDYMANLLGARDNVLALYHIAHLCLVSPRLVLTGERKEGEIGPRDLRWDDLVDIYLNFFVASLSARLPSSRVLTSPKGLWELHNLATVYHTRPSQILGIEDVYAAYCVDRVVAIAGTHWKPEKPLITVNG